MPYVSDAQRRFFYTKTARVKGITKAEVAEYDAASKGMKLPERSGKATRVKAKVRFKKKGKA